MQFRISLAFAERRESSWHERFLRQLFRLLPRDEITFSLDAIQYGPEPLTIHAILDVEPTGLDTLTDAELQQHLCGEDPTRVRCSVPLYTWLARLRSYSHESPMARAWQTFMHLPTSSVPAPIYLDRVLVLDATPTPKKNLSGMGNTDAAAYHPEIHRDDSASFCSESGDSFETAQSGRYSI